VPFGIISESLADVTQSAAFSASYKIAGAVELSCSSAAEWAQEVWPPSAPGEPTPLQENGAPFTAGVELKAYGVPIGFEAGQPTVMRFDGLERNRLLPKCPGVMKRDNVDGERIELFDEI
jgi:hypothetical protein